MARSRQWIAQALGIIAKFIVQTIAVMAIAGIVGMAFCLVIGLGWSVAMHGLAWGAGVGLLGCISATVYHDGDSRHSVSTR